MLFRRQHKSLEEMLCLYSNLSKDLTKNKGLNVPEKLHWHKKSLRHFINSLVLNHKKLISVRKNLSSSSPSSSSASSSCKWNRVSFNCFELGFHEKLDNVFSQRLQFSVRYPFKVRRQILLLMLTLLWGKEEVYLPPLQIFSSNRSRNRFFPQTVLLLIFMCLKYLWTIIYLCAVYTYILTT